MADAAEAALAGGNLSAEGITDLVFVFLGCSNHKYDNALKAACKAMHSVWDDLIAANPELKAPVPLPTLKDLTKADNADLVDAPNGAERLIVYLSLAFYNPSADKQTDKSTFEACLRDAGPEFAEIANMLLAVEEVGEARFHEKYKCAAGFLLGRGKNIICEK